VDTHLDMDENLLTPEEKFELAACVGEALINVHKHANATEVVLEIKVTDSECYLLIQDNGIGFNQKKISETDHYGIQMMQERCKKMNWNLEIESKQGRTRLSFTPK